MLRNYLKIALRNLQRNPGYTFINISGLTVALAVCLLIGLFIRHELSYDEFHEKADRIYRLVMGHGNLGGSSRIPAGATERLHQFPETSAAVRLYPANKVVLHEGKPIKEEQFYYADASFFNLFTFSLVAGNRATALRAPNTVVLTTSTAERYFGERNPIGQTLTLHDGTTLRVTGIVKDPPSNSHLQFDFLTSFSTLDQPRGMDYQSHIYLLLPGKEAAEGLDRKLDEITSAGMENMSEHFGFGITGAYFNLQSLTDIHLFPALGGAVQPEGNVHYLYIFGAVALFILLLAVINYMNLATARSARRAREIGMRKVLGAHRGQVAGQFLGESVLLSLLAFICALGLAQLLLPGFNSLLGKQLELHLARDWPFVACFAGVALLTGLFSGSYPALVLSGFAPTRILKGSFVGSSGNAWLRKGLVTFQFTVSIVLIVSTLVVSNQLGYIQNKRLGYDTEEILKLPMIESFWERLSSGKLMPDQQRIATIKRELLQVPGVQQVSVAYGTPNNYFTFNIKHEGQTYEVASLSVDHNYLETMGMTLVAGRGFSQQFVTDSTEAIIVNETAARVFGLEDKVGQTLEINLRYKNPKLIGIVSDFHTASLHNTIRPTVLSITPRRYNTYILRVNTSRLSSTLASLQETWQQLAPNYPFIYHFLDEQLEALYQSERRLAGAFGSFAALAVLIACLGLFGLAAFTAEQRTKEIGIRKVLGATVPNIVGLLSKDFLKLVGIAIVIATPIAYFVMNRWLQDFAYRIDLGLGVFLLAGLIAIVIAFLTVSYQSIKAALANPADILRYE